MRTNQRHAATENFMMLHCMVLTSFPHNQFVQPAWW